MRRTIILLFTILICFSSSSAQQADCIGDVLLQLEKQYYVSHSAEEKTQISLQKMYAYIHYHLESDEECLIECKRINPDYLNAEEKRRYLWNGAILYFLHNDFASSVDAIRAYQLMTKDSSSACQLLNILAVNSSPYDSLTEKDISPQLMELYNCLTTEKINLSKQNTKYNWCSYIVPGSGMMLKGYITKGSTALLLNAGSGLLVYSLFKNALYFNSIGYALLTISKFYVGNNVYTRSLVPKKKYESQKIKLAICHEQLNEFLTQHPIDFR